MEPLHFTEDELETMSRKDLQMHAKTHGLKANTKNSILIEQLREICQSRKSDAPKESPKEEVKETAKEDEKVEEMEVETKKPAKRGAKGSPKEEVKEPAKEEKIEVEPKKSGRRGAKESPKETPEEKAEEMEVETKKPAKRGAKRVASAPVAEEPKPKEAKVEEAKVEEKEEVPVQPVREKSPVPVINPEPFKDFMSPKVIREKMAHSARSFLTPVKDTPSKVMITPRSLKPSQGKILPKSPFHFNITNIDKKVPETPNTKKTQQDRSKIKSTLTSKQQDLMPISALDIYTVGVQTAPRLISTGAIQFVSHVLRRFIINLCSYALLENGDKKEIPFTGLTNAASEVFEEGEIHSQAIRESLSARDRYILYKDEEAYEMKAKAGLTIDLETVSKLLSQIGVNAEFTFVVGLSAICEYIVAEVFEVCPTVNVENDLIITRDVLISSLKTDKELYDLLSAHIQEENEIVEAENKKNLDAANKLIETLKKNQNWSKVAATEEEITHLETLLKTTLPTQLKTFFLAQNGNETFGIDDVATIMSEHGSSSHSSGDLLNILEFVPLKNRGNNEYDCYDALTGCIIRLILPMAVDEPRSFPVVASNLGDYIQKCIAGKLSVPKKPESTLGSVNIIASQVCDLFNAAKNAEEANHS